MQRVNAGKDRFWFRIIYIVSVVIAAAVAFLILGPRPQELRRENRCLSIALYKCDLEWDYHSFVDRCIPVNQTEKGRTT